MRTRQYRSIKAWQLADELTFGIYEVTKSFPKEELYGLVSQMRRASVSVPANIAEGAARASRKEYLQFLSIARGSLAELRYYVHLANRLGYLVNDRYAQLDLLGDEVARVLHGLMESIDQAIADGVFVPTKV